jgi:hypothetical protein
MNEKPIFSDEYSVTSETNAKPLNMNKQDKDEFVNKIEAEYELSKPRRIILRTRIIEK